MIIKEPICQPYELADAKHRTDVIMAAYARFPDQWKGLLPEFEVISTTTPFREINEIIDTILEGDEDEGEPADLDDPEYWDDVIVFGVLDDGVIHTLFIGGDETSAYDDQKLGEAFTRELAVFAWRNSGELRAHALKLAGRLRPGITEEMCLEIVREALTGLIFAPRTLKRQSSSMHDFIVELTADIPKLHIEAERMAVPA